MGVISRTEKEAALKHVFDHARSSLFPLNGSTQFVPGKGDILSRVILIGEAPGADEDRLGEPFVGRAGQLLTEALDGHGIPRNALYITNVVKYRPPNNRPPTEEEIKSHLPILEREVAIIDPVAILLLGSTALWAVARKKGITHLRGHRIILDIEPWKDRWIKATWHPAYLAYSPGLKDQWHQDFENFFESATNFLLNT